MKIEYLYINTLNPPSGYLEMLQKWYGKTKWDHFKRSQFEWYQSCPHYRIFTMKVDGEFVGQAAAYGVDVYKNGRIKELWWGVILSCLNNTEEAEEGSSCKNNYMMICPISFRQHLHRLME